MKTSTAVLWVKEGEVECRGSTHCAVSAAVKTGQPRGTFLCCRVSVRELQRLTWRREEGRCRGAGREGGRQR